MPIVVNLTDSGWIEIDGGVWQQQQDPGKTPYSVSSIRDRDRYEPSRAELFGGNDEHVVALESIRNALSKSQPLEASEVPRGTLVVVANRHGSEQLYKSEGTVWRPTSHRGRDIAKALREQFEAYAKPVLAQVSLDPATKTALDALVQRVHEQREYEAKARQELAETMQAVRGMLAKRASREDEGDDGEATEPRVGSANERHVPRVTGKLKDLPEHTVVEHTAADGSSRILQRVRTKKGELKWRTLVTLAPPVAQYVADLPDPSRCVVGTLLRVNDVMYAQTEAGWEAVGQPQESPSMSEQPKQNQVLKTLHTDATDAAWRTAGTQFVKLCRDPIIGMLQRHLAPGDEAFRGKVAAFLDTEIGTAMMASLLSVALASLPAASGEIPQKLSRELRVKGMADAGDAMADLLMGPLRQVIMLYLQDPAGMNLTATQLPADTGSLRMPAPAGVRDESKTR